MSPPSALNPLLLPEITFHLGPFLTNRSLFACIQVSQAWYRAFHPLLWFHIRLAEGDTTAPAYLSTLPNPRAQQAFLHLQKNAPLIQSLSINTLRDEADNRFLHLTFPQLHNLRVVFDETANNFRVTKIARIFIERHAAELHSLTLVGMIRHCRPWAVLQACQFHPGQLRVLTLRTACFAWDHWSDAHRQLLSGLEALTLHDSPICFRSGAPEDNGEGDFLGLNEHHDPDEASLERRGKFWKDLKGVKIQSLSMTDSSYWIKEEYYILLDCRELRSLQWVTKPGHDQGNRKPALAKGLREGQWQFLERLELMMFQFSDAELAEILEAMPRPLKTLRMDKTSFAEASTRALLESGGGHHRKSLEILSLVGCADLQGSMVQQFLCGLPCLRRLHARILTDQDIAMDPRPWVCQNLRDLQVGFVHRLFFKNSAGESIIEFDSEDPLSASVLFGRIATLSNLHTLGFMDSKPFKEYVWIKEELAVRAEYHRPLIKNGLDALKSLTGMRFLKFGETDQDLTLEEARWMVEHWPKLSSVAVSRATAHKEMKIQLRTFFNSQSINCM